jgi:hypothetical protein
MLHVSAHKKLFIFFTLAVIALVASATTTEAQGRRRGRGSRVVVVGGYYANPFFYDPFFADPWYGYQYPWHPYGYGYGPEASVRLEVSPKEAEVYIDGYYAGVVDDFDGAFQRLRVEPGEHEIEIYLEGYRPFSQKVYLTPDKTFKIRHTLQPLAAGEQPPPKPQPVNPPAAQGQGGPQGPPAQGQPMPRAPMGRRPPPPPQGGSPANPPSRRGQTSSDYGTLTIRVQPADAEVSIDGANWRGPAAQDRLVIEIAEGSHTVEIRKPGFRTYVTQVEIRRGETSPLNVSLREQ